MSQVSQKVRKLTSLAILTAIIVVLSLAGSFIKVGLFSISLTLAPIIIGAALFGATSGAFLGAVFGVVVTITCAMGWDIGGAMLWNVNPFLTALVCVLKGALAGFVAGGVYHLLSKIKPKVAAIGAGIVCPIINTTIFVAALYFLFYETLLTWAAGGEMVAYVLTGLVGVNFILELIVNLVLSNVIVTVVGAMTHKKI